MATGYLVMLVFISNCFIHAESLKCIRCSSTDFNSPCRLGTDTTEFECPDHEKACYAEYFYGDRADDEHLYRRGCAETDWCRSQKGLHGNDIKYCKTCEEEKCNVDIIGSPDSSQIQCYTCSSSDDTNSPCRIGGIDLEKKQCRKGIKNCYYDYVSTTSRQEFSRGCAKDDYCASRTNEWGDSLEVCKYCKDDLCNTHYMKLSLV